MVMVVMMVVMVMMMVVMMMVMMVVVIVLVVVQREGVPVSSGFGRGGTGVQRERLSVRSGFGRGGSGVPVEVPKIVIIGSGTFVPGTPSKRGGTQESVGHY